MRQQAGESPDGTMGRQTGPQDGLPLRVMYVVTSETTADLFVARFADYLANKLSADVTVVADTVESLVANYPDSAARFVAVPMRRDPHPVRDLMSLVRMIRQIWRCRPDCVLYATPKASLVTAIASFVCRVPVRIYQIWGLRLETTSGASRRILGELEKLTSRLSTHVLANSPSLATQIRDLKLAGRHKVAVLGQGSSHGVDTIEFHPGIIGELATEEYEGLDPETHQFLHDHDGLVLGFVGRLHPDKGIDTLIEALGMIHGRGLDVRLLFVGRNEGYDAVAAASRAGVREAVHLAGNRAPTQPYYGKMDALILPSLREGFPNVVLEASAMGIPAVVSDATGVRDSVVDGRTGTVFPTGDAGALADAIELLHSQPELRRQMGRNARVRVEKHFTEESVWARLADFVTRSTSSRAR